jgi:hypothetical protein
MTRKDLRGKFDLYLKLNNHRCYLKCQTSCNLYYETMCFWKRHADNPNSKYLIHDIKYNSVDNPEFYVFNEGGPGIFCIAMFDPKYRKYDNDPS